MFIEGHHVSVPMIVVGASVIAAVMVLRFNLIYEWMGKGEMFAIGVGTLLLCAVMFDIDGREKK